MKATIVLVWLLITVQMMTSAGCAALLKRHHQPDTRHLARTLHRCAPALLAAAVLPVSALLMVDAPAAAWGLWGALTIAAALVYAYADTLRDIPANRAAPRPGSGP